MARPLHFAVSPCMKGGRVRGLFHHRDPPPQRFEVKKGASTAAACTAHIPRRHFGVAERPVPLPPTVRFWLWRASSLKRGGGRKRKGLSAAAIYFSQACVIDKPSTGGGRQAADIGPHAEGRESRERVQGSSAQERKGEGTASAALLFWEKEEEWKSERRSSKRVSLSLSIGLSWEAAALLIAEAGLCTCTED